MKSTISFARFERKLSQPFRYGTRAVESRAGFILRKESTGGFRYSEASPLPGHSRESLEEVARALETGSRELPSLCFALDALEMHNIAEFFPVRSNALVPVGCDADEALSRFRRLGYTHCKLKLAAESPEQIANLIDAHSGLLYRLDANRTLSPSILDELISLLDRRSLLDRIDYIEEPFEGIWKSSIFRNAPVAFAADESAGNSAEIKTLLGAENAPRVMVLKPTVQGSLVELSAMEDLLTAKKVRAVFTSSLET